MNSNKFFLVKLTLPKLNSALFKSTGIVNSVLNELKNIIIIIIIIIIAIIIIIIIIKASSFKIAEIKNVAILCVIKVAPVKHDA